MSPAAIPRAGVRYRPARRANAARPVGLGWLLAAELLSGLLGFTATVHLARRLGPGPFGRVELAAAVAAWMLVVVRSGFEAVAFREAARRPRLIRPLTNILIGLKLAGAAVGYAVVLIVAAMAGAPRGGPIALAGLLLFPAALAADVGPRARGRLGPVALALVIRSVALAGAAFAWVSGPEHAGRAALVAVVGELAGSTVLLVAHARRFGRPRPRLGRRAWSALARRGAIASAMRFGRVGIYGADMLVLGWLATADAGPYAAARRIVLALVALGLVVPSAVAPLIARAWAAGRDEARAIVSLWLGRLLAASIVASAGLAITAGLWMPLLFGAPYRRGGPWLALVAARLPCLLVASFAQAALVACRREADGLRQVLMMVALAAVLVPSTAALAGAWGVGLALIVVEAAGAVLGWRSLRELGLAPSWRGDRFGGRRP